MRESYQRPIDSLPFNAHLIHMIRFVVSLVSFFVVLSGWAATDNENLLERARNGDADAQFLIGYNYATGHEMQKDSAEAAKWYRMAAENEILPAPSPLPSPFAEVASGTIPALIVPPIINADAISPEQWFVIMYLQNLKASGIDYYDTKNSSSILFNSSKISKKQLEIAESNGTLNQVTVSLSAAPKLVTHGHADAQFRLGVMYTSGWGVPKDSAEAARWFLKSAEQGNAAAQSCLGWAYTHGDGVPKSSTEAVRWLRKAAEKGDAQAQGYLGWMYVKGDGVPTDGAEAIKWLNKAAEQGDATAQYCLGWVYTHGDVVPKNVREAAKFYRMAAEQGDDTAQGTLGAMYADGEGVPKDAIEGLAWTNLAAASGAEIWIKNRNIIEARLGTQATLAAQQRSKNILSEIGAAKHESKRSALTEPPTDTSLKTERPKASGSGTIISTAGYILTAAHVVADASGVRILTVQGMKSAKIIRIDKANDLAVLKLEAGTYPALPIATSRKIRLGQPVATIGFPNIQIQGFSPKVTRGEISSINGINDDPRAWQISVPVQPGNSGGPLLDENGNLVGVVVSKLGLEAAAATGDLPQNVNYAVKSSYALALLESYMDRDSPEANQGRPKFEDMVTQAQPAVVLILVY